MPSDTNLEKLVAAVERASDPIRLVIEIESIGTTKRRENPAASRLVTVNKISSTGKVQQLAAWAGAGYGQEQSLENLSGRVVEELAIKAMGGDLEGNMTGTQPKRRKRR